LIWIKGDRPHFSLNALMPWSETAYPIAMQHLLPEVRAKAIEIANALVREGWEDSDAIRAGLEHAKQWSLGQTLKQMIRPRS
jgi:uncharacterized protein YdaT